ncbi:MAG: F0F1 ATP synthase subunit delta [Bacilli bacterium]
MDSLASRYSSALFSIAEEENKIKEYQEACKVFSQCIEENPKYMQIISSYFIKKDEKKQIVNEVVNKFKLPMLTSFVDVVFDNNRENCLLEILSDFNTKCNDKQNILEGIIYSVIELDKNQISRIEEVISKKLGKKVELKNEINSNLIGGVKVVINDTVFDGSITHRIESLKHSLTKGGH